LWVLGVPSAAFDNSVEVVRTEERGKPDIQVAPTKTANRRYVGLDAEQTIDTSSAPLATAAGAGCLWVMKP
jgi:hypothetical protein